MNRKILYIHYGRKGIDGWGRSFKIASSLTKLGENVTFITLQNKNRIFPYIEEIIQNVKVVSFPELLPSKLKKLGFGFLSIYLKKRYLQDKEFDLLITDTIHRPSSYKIVNYAKKILKIKYISEWWDYYGSGGQYENKNRFFKYFFGYKELKGEIAHRKNVDGIICLSEFTKERAISSGIKEDKLIVVHGGCDVSQIKYYNSSIIHRKKYNIPEDKLVLGFIGINETEIEDLEPFLNVMPELSKQNKICWFTTGQILSKKTKIKYDIGNELIELGWVDEKEFNKVISCADVFLLLQKDNLKNKARWPNKLGDYLSAGRPVLTNPINDIKIFIEKYPEGFILVEWNKNSIIAVLYYILNHSSILLKASKINRTIAENSESWLKKAEIIKSFYEALLLKK